MSQKDSDLDRIKQILQLMKDNNLAEVEISHGDDKIFLKRAQAESPVPPIAVPVMAPMAPAASAVSSAVEQKAAAPPAQNLIEVKSPLVGTFYAQASPDSEPFVEVGARVEPQTVVCIIEAMKVMNEIKAETTGTIAAVCVANGQAVEYGQVLFKVKPD